METIAIIGGGFSGTMTAVNLARLGTRTLRVCVINGGHPAGCGSTGAASPHWTTRGRASG